MYTREGIHCERRKDVKALSRCAGRQLQLLLLSAVCLRCRSLLVGSWHVVRCILLVAVSYPQHDRKLMIISCAQAHGQVHTLLQQYVDSNNNWEWKRR